MAIVARGLLAGAVLILPGCVSMGTLQRAETLGTGHWQMGLEASTQGPIIPDLPNVGASFRWGVSDWFDVGGRVSVTGFEGDLKVMLTDRGAPVILSLAPSIGGWPDWPIPANCPKGGCTSAATGFTNLSLPFLIGFPVGTNELILAPRLTDFSLWSRSTIPNGPGNGSGNTLYAGMSVGFAIRFNNTFQLVPEIGAGVPALEWTLAPQGNTVNQGAESIPYALGPVLQLGLGFLFGV